MSEISKHSLGLQQGEELVIHFVPDQKAIKITAKFTRPNAPEQGTTRTLAVEDLRAAPEPKLRRPSAVRSRNSESSSRA